MSKFLCILVALPIAFALYTECAMLGALSSIYILEEGIKITGCWYFFLAWIALMATVFTISKIGEPLLLRKN